MDFITVDPAGRHLSDAAGQAFIPAGVNLCFPRFVQEPAEGLARMLGWLDRLAEVGGNAARIFLGDALLEIEPERCGVFASTAEERLATLVAHAARRRVRLILVLQHFRTIGGTAAPLFPGAACFERAAYHERAGGPAADMAAFLDTPAGRAAFLRRLDRLAARLRDEPAILAWELWNEMDCVRGGDYLAWTSAMATELKARCPRQLVMQSWGSLDSAKALDQQRAWAVLPGLDAVQVHRYLDAGAGLPVCHGAVDALSADAIASLRDHTARPLLLGEGGAVEPRHAGPWRLYEADRAGTVLHDVLFAPFAAGACGGGLCWHWDFYVERHQLWRQIGRFVQSVAGFDPRGCTPERCDQQGLRVHVLRGEGRLWAWIRDGHDWQAELRDLQPPPLRRGLRLDLGGAAGDRRCYDPWSDRWCALPADGTLPDFRRSLVLRLG